MKLKVYIKVTPARHPERSRTFGLARKHEQMRVGSRGSSKQNVSSEIPLRAFAAQKFDFAFGSAQNDADEVTVWRG